MPINKAILMGRLVRDPELRTTESQKSVTNFTIAVDNGYGEDKKTDFISCVAWNKTAEMIAKYFAKGRMIAVVGRISTRTWEGQDGKKNYVTEVTVSEVSFCGDKSEGQNDSTSSESSEGDGGFVPLGEVDADDCPF